VRTLPLPLWLASRIRGAIPRARRLGPPPLSLSPLRFPSTGLSGAIAQTASTELLFLADLWSFDKQHLNSEDFSTPRNYEASFQASPADQSILQDQDPHYRVFNLQNPFNDALTSYYHHSIGGYHGAKLARYQELFEFVISEEHGNIVDHLQKNRGQNIEGVFNGTKALNMLNARYVIYNPNAAAIKNSRALGNAWFIKKALIVPTADEEILQIKSIDPGRTALIHKEFQDYLPKQEYSGQGQIELTQ